MFVRPFFYTCFEVMKLPGEDVKALVFDCTQEIFMYNDPKLSPLYDCVGAPNYRSSEPKDLFHYACVYYPRVFLTTTFVFFCLY